MLEGLKNFSWPIITIINGLENFHSFKYKTLTLCAESETFVPCETAPSSPRAVPRSSSWAQAHAHVTLSTVREKTCLTSALDSAFHFH